MANLTPAPLWITEGPIAHRGYHNLKLGRAENSLSAFSAAIEAGFAIECDLQVSATGQPVVFHDPTLERMTGVAGNVKDYTPAELSRLHLLDTADCIETLDRHLALVNAKVPVILELKGVEGADSGFVEGVAESLKRYDGRVAVMSFDNWICAQFASVIPDVPRGLTAEGGNECYRRHIAAMETYDLQFVSYSVQEVDNRFVAEMRKLGLPVITWTVRNAETRHLSEKFADQMTFENFDPRELQNG